MLIEKKIPINNSEAKDILTKKMKDKELNYDQQLAYEYLKNTTKLNKTDASKLADELKEQGLKEEQIINIVNLVASDEEVLKLILKKEGEVTPAKIKEIVKIVGKYS